MELGCERRGRHGRRLPTPDAAQVDVCSGVLCCCCTWSLLTESVRGGCVAAVEVSSAGNSESSHDVRLDNSKANGPWPDDECEEEEEEVEAEKEG